MIQSEGEYTKPYPNIFAMLWKDVEMDKDLALIDGFGKGGEEGGRRMDGG